MAAVRCPRCSHVFPVDPEDEATQCPSCGHVAALAERFPLAEGEAPLVREPWTPVAEIVGRPRRTGTTLGLILLTLGVYRAVHRFRTFRELDDQHGLRHHYLLHLWGGALVVLGLVGLGLFFTAAGLCDVEGGKDAPFGGKAIACPQDFGGAQGPVEVVLGAAFMATLFFHLALLLTGLALGMVYHFLELRRLQAYRVGRGMGPGLGWAGYYAWILLLPVVGWFVSVAMLNRSARAVWRKVYAERNQRFPWNA